MSERKSKFAAILRREDAAVEEPITPVGETKPEMAPTTLTTTQKRPRGRPGGQGKRLNPDFVQVTAYIPGKLHTDTKINLLKQGEKKEFSELIAELLAAWNKKQST